MIAGTLAGLFGVGGGLIIVPALVFVFDYNNSIPTELKMHIALGTSLATIIVTSMSSVRAHHKRGAVDWKIFLAIAPGIVLGSLGGAQIAGVVSSFYLQLAFGIFALCVAMQMALGIKPSAKRKLPGRMGLGGAGIIIGTISALAGIGGGCISVPFLTSCKVPVHKAVATSAAIGLPIAIAGTIGYILSGMKQVILPAWSTGYIYWPAVLGIVSTSFIFAPLGANLAHRLSPQKLKKAFAGFLGVVSVMVIRSAFLS